MNEKLHTVIKTENITCDNGDCSTFCQCCSTATDNLKYMTQTFVYENRYEMYSEMLFNCFSIKISQRQDDIPKICEDCICKLRDSYSFKLQVESAQDKLKNVIFEEDVKNDFTDDQNRNSVDIKEEDDISYQLDDIFHNEDSIDAIDIEKLKPEGVLSQENGDIVIKKIKKRREKFKKIKKKRKDLMRDECKKYKCNECNEEYQTKRQLTRHLKEHNQLFICHICGKESPSKKLLHSHMVSHSSERVQCNFCSKYMKKYSLQRHVLKHSGNPYIYPCKLCPDKFPSYNTRLTHLAIAHGLSEKKYPCKVCDKSFRFSGGLSTHVKRCHLQEKKCICIECGKSFFSKNELVKHMLKHTKLRLFQCEVCLKSYGRKSTLQSHMKIHSNIKAHKCQICMREFTQKCTLLCHIKVHEKMNMQQMLPEKKNV